GALRTPKERSWRSFLRAWIRNVRAWKSSGNRSPSRLVTPACYSLTLRRRSVDRDLESEARESRSLDLRRRLDDTTPAVWRRRSMGAEGRRASCAPVVGRRT